MKSDINMNSYLPGKVRYGINDDTDMIYPIVKADVWQNLYVLALIILVNLCNVLSLLNAV